MHRYGKLGIPTLFHLFQLDWPEYINPEADLEERELEVLLPLLRSRFVEKIKKRPRLEHLSSFHDAVELIKKSKNIVVLTGAGVSVSCGIPDFRSKNGIYSRLSELY